MKMDSLRRMKGGLVVLGAFLIFLTLGSEYSFGNITTYLTSYIRARSVPKSLRYGESVWIWALTFAGHGGFMFLGGLINLKLGPRLTALLGCITMSTGVFITYFTIRWSFFGCLLTYGFVFGAGVGIAYAPPLSLAMKWFPSKKGLVNGISLAGFGGGAFIFNQIQSFYINPANKVPDELQSGTNERYFSEAKAGDVLDRVPYCFLILGCCYCLMQIIGCLLLFQHPSDGKCDKVPLLYEDVSMTESIAINDGLKEEGNVHATTDVHPKEMLKCKSFYMLWFMFLLTGQAVTFTSTLYKTFGQTFIHDDQFLAVVGAISSLFNAGGRIFWGYLADHFSFRTTMMVLCTCLIALLLTFYSTIYGGKIMYFIWVCGLFFSFAGTFSLFPTVIAKSYGPKYMPVNFGLLFTSQVVTGIIGAVLTTSLTDLTTWYGMFFIIASFVFLALIIAFFFNVRGANGCHV